VQHRYAGNLRQLCLQMHQRGATAVVMGGGPLAGLAAKLAPTCPVPLIDGTQGAINILRTVALRRETADAG
jgi:allantoin racemase